MEFGKKLKEERERQGYSLEAVEEETKIRKTYIKALEDEEFSLLPPRVYAIGFLKLYSNFLKLDSEGMVNEFKLLAYDQEEEKESLKVPASKEYEYNWFSRKNLNKVLSSKEYELNWLSSKNLKKILAAGIFLLLIIWMGNSLVGYFADKGANEQNPPGPSVSEQPKENVKPPKVVVKQANVVIDATQKCWLNVKVDDQQQFQGILLPGQTKSFTGKKSVLVNAGNAGGINITFNNKKLGPMGTTGQVLEQEYKIE